MQAGKPKKSEQTRKLLIESARQLFSERGYQSTGVDDIVGSIGLTSGVFYANFESKEELFKTALASQIQHSRQVLLTMRPDEDSASWIKRVLSIYLSPIHRDRIESSCPMTSLSQELMKLGWQKKTGLSDYLQEFEGLLAERLEQIRPGLGAQASSLIAICVGAIEVSRIAKDKGQSDRILMRAQEAVSLLIFGSKSESEEK